MEGSERLSTSGVSLAQQYEIGALIGGGKYSRVFAARCNKTGIEVALKVVSKRLITTPAAPPLEVSSVVGLRPAKAGGSLAPPPPRLSDEERAGCPWPSDELSVAVSTRLKRIRTEYYVLLEQLREEHPLLVDVERIGLTTNFLFFAMRRYRTGSLGQFLSSPNSVRRLTLSEDEARFVLCEVLLALEYLHFRGIVYRDLKPENILLTDDLHCVLSDFDLCYAPAAHDDLASSEMSESQHLDDTLVTKSIVDASPAIPPSRASVASSRTSSLVSNAQSDIAVHQAGRSPQPSPGKPPRGAPGTGSPPIGQPSHQRSTSFVGTLEYISPDVLKDEPVTAAVDMWSLGMLLYELLFGFTLFRGNDERDTLFKINEYCGKGKDAKPSFPIQPSVTDDARDLLSKLLHPSRSHRLTVESVREHAWIRKGYPPVKLRNIHRAASPLHSVLASKAVHRDACGAPSKHYDKYFQRPLRKRTKDEFDSIASATESGNERSAAAREEENRNLFLSESVVDECVSTLGLSFFVPVAKHRSGAGVTRTAEELAQLFVDV